MVNLQDTPSAGLLTAADLKAARQINPGRIYLATHRATPMTDPTEAPELLRRGQKPADAPDTMPVEYGTGYGDLAPVKQPRVVPCSTLARWWLRARDALGDDFDGNDSAGLAVVVGVAVIALLCGAAWVSASLAAN